MSVRSSFGRRASGAQSTAAVLWLMILLVFLPIAAGHVIARLASHEATQEAR